MNVEAEGAAAGGTAKRKIRYTLYPLKSELLNSSRFILTIFSYLFIFILS